MITDVSMGPFVSKTLARDHTGTPRGLSHDLSVVLATLIRFSTFPSYFRPSQLCSISLTSQ